MKASKSNSKKVEIVDGPGVKKRLVEMLADEQSKHICIASPYFREYGADVILKPLEKAKVKNIVYPMKILISLEINDFVFGSSDIKAVDRALSLVEEYSCKQIELRHLPSLHAKIYLSNKVSIVGSVNLTRPGLDKNGNLESACIAFDNATIGLLQEQFDGLWSRGRVVTPELWKIRRKQIIRLSDKYQKQIKGIHEDIRSERIALERMPNEDAKADYYSKLLACLKWISSGEGKRYKANRPLVKFLRDQSSSNNQEGNVKTIGVGLAMKRIAFMKELGLISLRNRSWYVTPTGKQLDENLTSRKRLFGELLRWCENQGDEQFRVLLQTIDDKTKNDMDEVSLKNWFKSIPISDCQSWWRIREKGDSGYDKFCPKSCSARNWLVSLGVIDKRASGEDFYSRGDLYTFISPRGAKGKPFDARLNAFITDEENF